MIIKYYYRCDVVLRRRRTDSFSGRSQHPSSQFPPPRINQFTRPLCVSLIIINQNPALLFYLTKAFQLYAETDGLHHINIVYNYLSVRRVGLFDIILILIRTRNVSGKYYKFGFYTFFQLHNVQNDIYIRII